MINAHVPLSFGIRQLTRVLILKLAQVVDITINDDVQVVRLIVRRNICGAEGLRHDDVTSGMGEDRAVERPSEDEGNGKEK